MRMLTLSLTLAVLFSSLGLAQPPTPRGIDPGDLDRCGRALRRTSTAFANGDLAREQPDSCVHEPLEPKRWQAGESSKDKLQGPPRRRREERERRQGSAEQLDRRLSTPPASTSPRVNARGVRAVEGVVREDRRGERHQRGPGARDRRAARRRRRGAVRPLRRNRIRISPCSSWRTGSQRVPRFPSAITI